MAHSARRNVVVQFIEGGQRGADAGLASIGGNLDIGHRPADTFEFGQRLAELGRRIDEGALVGRRGAVEGRVQSLQLGAGRVGGVEVVTHGSLVGRSSGGSWFPSRSSCASAAAAASDAALDRTDRDAQRVGDLGIVEVGHVAQDDGHAEVGRQVGQRSVDRQPIGHRLEPQARIGICPVGVVIVSLVVAETVCRLSIGQDRAPPSPAQFVEAGVGGDAVDPRAEGRPSVELGQAAHHRDHRLLRGVGSVGVVAEDAPADREHAVVVQPQQLVHRAPVAPDGCGDQRGLVVAHP